MFLSCAPPGVVSRLKNCTDDLGAGLFGLELVWSAFNLDERIALRSAYLASGAVEACVGADLALWVFFLVKSGVPSRALRAYTARSLVQASARLLLMLPRCSYL